MVVFQNTDSSSLVAGQVLAAFGVFFFYRARGGRLIVFLTGFFYLLVSGFAIAMNGLGRFLIIMIPSTFTTLILAQFFGALIHRPSKQEGRSK